ncbi:MAG: type II secretion system protein [Clostridia bacterium]|nr:type II secretion system protein [Clostridia bacterium]
MKTKGFTLVELLVVIAILAILATVSVVGYTSFINNADKSAMDQETHQIETVIESALIINDYAEVKLGATPTSYYIYKNASGAIVVSATKPAGTGVDLTADIGAELVAKLSYNSGLVYTYKTGSTATKTLYNAAE